MTCPVVLSDGDAYGMVVEDLPPNRVVWRAGWFWWRCPRCRRHGHTRTGLWAETMLDLHYCPEVSVTPADEPLPTLIADVADREWADLVGDGAALAHAVHARAGNDADGVSAFNNFV